MSEYKKIHPNCLINKDSGYDLLKYENGDFYKEHIDEYTDVQRVLSLSIALNDDYDGGEFSFFSDTVNFKLNKGDVIIFPSNFMFPHQIKTIENGTRYSIVSWIY
jgi:predicted 2-oxoglutarate/Fe(II)-dependent dioxygenase YbiX